MSHESSLIRRSSAACLIVICRYARYPMAVARYLMTYAIGTCFFVSFLVLITAQNLTLDQLLEHHNQTDSTRLINGYLVLIKNLVQLLGMNIEEFVSSSKNVQQSLNTSKSLDANEQHLPINIRQLIEVRNLSFHNLIQI